MNVHSTILKINMLAAILFVGATSLPAQSAGAPPRDGRNYVIKIPSPSPG
jgi:hypothetical protein